MKKTIANYFSKQNQSSICLWSNELKLDNRLFCLLNSHHIPNDPNIELLKQSRRRCVLRINNFSANQPSLVIKHFPLNKIESRLKYKKYGLAEAYNYLCAKDFSISIPECFGYFENRSFGMVIANGIIIQDLKGFNTLQNLYRKSPEQKLTILNKAIPVIFQLFENGVNHIDINPNNLLESPNRKKMFLIDWQYCSFLNPRNIKQIILQSAYFLKSCELDQNDPIGIVWLENLYDTCKPNISWNKFRNNVARLQSSKRPSNQDRINLKLDLFE